VIKFKKGAFASLRGVKPFSAKTWSLSGCNANSSGGLSFFKQTIVTAQSIFYTYSLKEMPVFEPNEYFWKHHWDGKEEKWVVYARVI